MSYHWHKEESPRWDADKQRIFGAAELAAAGCPPRRRARRSRTSGGGSLDDSGTVVGYGWLDSEWGDAQISFLVSGGRAGRGHRRFVVDRLEDEARRRGFNYIYNVVPASHPDRRG